VYVEFKGDAIPKGGDKKIGRNFAILVLGIDIDIVIDIN
jgi:hypothetical protein